MNSRERLAMMVVIALGSIAVTCIIAVAAMPDHNNPIAMALVAIACSAGGALGGALSIPHPVVGERLASQTAAPPDPPSGMPPRG